MTTADVDAITRARASEAAAAAERKRAAAAERLGDTERAARHTRMAAAAAETAAAAWAEVIPPAPTPTPAPTDAGSDPAPATVLGIATPRISTPPLGGRELTRETSLGFEFCDWAAETLGWTPLPWQRELAIRMLELSTDSLGRRCYRFRTVVVLVGRQNGKSQLAAALALWKMVRDPDCDLVVGAAQTVNIAREVWQRAWDMLGAGEATRFRDALYMAAGREKFHTFTDLGDLKRACEYRIVAATRRGGRGLSVDHLLLDELREQQDWLAWSALSKTTNARPNPQILVISNAGDDTSVVLNHLQGVGRAAAEQGVDYEGDLGYFEWSGPDGCDLDDVDALRQACPAVGHLTPIEVLLSQAASEPADQFRTEVLCTRVPSLDAAVDAVAWAEQTDRTMRSIASVRPVCLGVDVGMSEDHITLVAATQRDQQGRVRVEVVRAWSDVSTARAELPGLLRRIRPHSVGYLPTGPAAALKAELEAALSPRQLKGMTEAPAVCMNLAQMVDARRVVHGPEPLLDSQLAAATKLRQGDAWRFARQGGVGNVDAAYALAMAVFLAQRLPKKGRRMTVVST